MFTCEYLTHEQMHSYYNSILRDMARLDYRPDLIVAPMRGGADMGVKFSHYFNVPVISLQWQTRDGGDKDTMRLREILRQHNSENILIVDDICDTGTTLSEMDVCLDRHQEMEGFIGTVNTAVALYKESSGVDVTFHGRSIYPDADNTWYVFPWEEWWK